MYTAVKLESIKKRSEETVDSSANTDTENKIGKMSANKTEILWHAITCICITF